MFATLKQVDTFEHDATLYSKFSLMTCCLFKVVCHSKFDYHIAVLCHIRVKEYIADFTTFALVATLELVAKIQEQLYK